MDEFGEFARPRAWWDPLAAFGVAVLGYALLTLWEFPYLHPAVWDDVAIAAGLRPPVEPFPGVYRTLVGCLFRFLGPGTALDLLPHLGRAAVSLSMVCVYLVFRETLPATLRLKVHTARIGARVGRFGALLAALLFLCAEPVWRAGQTLTPVSVFVLLCTLACYCFFRFLRLGRILPLYVCFALIGVISAESTLGFLLLVLAAFCVVVAVNWASNPDVPLVNPLVDSLVREVVFKRLTYVWAFFFALFVGLNVWQFVATGGPEAVGGAGLLDLLFVYFRGAWFATRSAASPLGWLFGFLLCVAPFVLALKLLPRAWDDDKFLPWIVGVVYAVVGVVALSQLAGGRVLWFWTWFPERSLVPSDMLLVFFLLFNVATVAFAVAVFGIDACCRNYRRIAHQQYPESMLEAAPAQMAESLGKARALRKRLFWLVVALVPLSVLPGRRMPAERGMLALMKDYEREFLAETKGCDLVFTDGSFDALHGLECLRAGRTLHCLSLMAPNTPGERMIRMRVSEGEEDEKLLQNDAATAMRSWVATKSAHLEKSAVQIGFELWKKNNLEPPAFSGVCGFPGGLADEERARALDATKKLADRVYDFANERSPGTSPDLALRRKFSFVIFRIARLAQMRSWAADRLGRREDAVREAAHAEELDRVNYELEKQRRRLDWLRAQRSGGTLTPREGLVIGLSRADFALAGQYAGPILRTDPDDPRANFALGMKFFQEELWARAEEHLARCLIRRPDEPAVLNNLAVVQMHLKKFAEAEKNARHALEKHPDIPEIKKTLDRVLKAKDAGK